MPDLIRTTTNFEYFTHRVLWAAVSYHMDHAKEKPEGSYYFYLSATYLAYAAFEAYVNHLLHTLFFDVWEQERSCFSNGEYKGTEGKLRFVFHELRLDMPNMNHKPYNSIRELKSIRDDLAHAKPFKGVHIAVHPVDKIVPREPFWLDRQIGKRKTQNLIANFEIAIENLHKLLISHPETHDLWPTALRGSISHGIITTDVPG